MPLGAGPWEPADGEPGAGERADILIVDDLPEKLLVFRTVLEELGQNLVLVRSGADALREILRRDFAVIMLDVNMPGMDGFETATLIRRHRRGAQTPIIFVTSYADEIQTARGYSLGAVDYILSPVVPEILRSKVSVFVSLHLMQRQIRRQADARAAMMAAEAGRRVAEENDRRSAFLAHAGQVLGGSLDLGVAMRQLTGLLVGAPAQLALVRIADRDLGRGAFAVAAQGPGGEALAASGEDGEGLDAAVLALLAEAAAGRRALRFGPEALAGCGAEAFGLAPGGPVAPALRAGVALPLIFGERVFGALLVASADARAWEQGAELTLLQEVAASAANAFEKARLYGILQHEIIERQAAQHELLQASQRKDEFLAMMSHELRNPLASIHTAIEVVRRLADPHPKVNWALDMADRQLRQITRLVEELLDVTRISQGKITLKREPVDLHRVIGQGIETVQPLIDGRQQQLRVSAPIAPLWLNADAARLTQVIANLLHNAAKYSPERSAIDLAVKLDGASIVLTVRDQGMGIDDDLLPRIFDLFSQGKRGLDRSQGGLGVGLTLARRLTEMHGGRIEVRSAGRNLGSEFEVRLPAGAVDAAQPATAPAPPAGAMQRERILVVDDNFDAAQAVAAVLEMEGHLVWLAADGEQALAAFARERPSVVVLDIGLPRLDGYTVARRIRDADGASLLLIALTGYGQPEDRRTALAAGFDCHLVKPVGAAVLLGCIRDWREAGARAVLATPAVE